MKFFQIILIFSLLGGCSYRAEEFNYLGTAPFYAVGKPHPVGCECCNFLTPNELHKKLLEVKKNKKSS